MVGRCLEGKIWEVGPEQFDFFPDLIGDMYVRKMRTDVVDVWKVADEVLERKVEVDVW